MSVKKDSVLLIITSEGILGDSENGNIAKLAEAFKAAGSKVIDVVTEGRVCASGYADITVKKRKLSSFFGTDMDILLKDMGIKTVYICGAYTDIDVRSTAVDAHQNNYYFHVVTDAVCATTQQAQKCALWNMKYLQRESNITTADILKEA